MAQRILCVAAVLTLAIGCGQSEPPTPAQLVNMGHYDEAIQACTQSIHANPRDAAAYLYRGRAYHCRNAPGDIELAVLDFTESIGLAPKDPEAYYSRALAHRDSGHAQDAERDEKRARELDPRLPEVYAEIPTPELPVPKLSNADQVSEEEPLQNKPGAEDDSSTLGRGIGYRPESRKDRQNGPSAPGSAEPGRFGAAKAPAAAGQRVLDDRLPVLTQPRYTLPSPNDRLPGDDDAPANDVLLKRNADGLGLPKVGERSRNETSRLRGSTTGAPAARSPLQAQIERPLQSPFPQRPPRPTGFVEEKPLPTTDRTQPRRSFNTPYSVPTVHPPGAYHDDYNP